MYVMSDGIGAVVDIGTETAKIGYTEAHLPMVHCPSPNSTNGYTSPVTRSVVSDVDSYMELLGSRVPSDAGFLIVAENTMEGSMAKREILGRLMERKLCDSVLFVRSGILDAFSYGKTTALVVSFGGGSTQVCSVIEGFITCRRQMDVGGLDLTKLYREVLRSSGVDLSSLVRERCERRREFEELELCRHAKEQTLTFEPEESGALFELRNGEFVDLGKHRETVALELLAATRLIVDVIEANSSEGQQSLVGNIVVSGGGTGIRGMDVAIAQQLAKERPEWKARVVSEKNMYCTFQGGAIAGCIGSAKSLHIGTADYREYGEVILDRKNCDWLMEPQPG
jgi:actin-like protein 6A